MPDVPAKSAPKAEWVEFAVSTGADRDEAESMTKADLVAEFGSTEPTEFGSGEPAETEPDEGETDNPSPDQPPPEQEALAEAAAAPDEGEGDSLTEELGDQPRHEFETAARVRAEQTATGEVEPPETEEQFASDRLLPGEVVGAEGPPPAPYQFSPRDGQFEGQQERNDSYAEKLADYHEQNVAKAEEQAGEQPPEPDSEEQEQASDLQQANQEAQN